MFTLALIFVSAILWMEHCETSRIIIVEEARPCFRRLATGRSLIDRFVRKTIYCDSLRSCEEACVQETTFNCEGFNFKFDRSGYEQSKCQLTTVPSSKLSLTSDFNSDRDFDFYEKDRNAPRSCFYPYVAYRPWTGYGGPEYGHGYHPNYIPSDGGYYQGGQPPPPNDGYYEGGRPPPPDDDRYYPLPHRDDYNHNQIAPPKWQWDDPNRYGDKGYDNGGGGQHAFGLAHGWGLPDECFVRTRTGFRLDRAKVILSLTVPSLYDCEYECVNERKFTCNVFSFRYSVSPSVPGDNCHLGESHYRSLDSYTDILPDRDYDIYERNPNGREGCQPKRYWGSDCFERVRSGLRLKDTMAKYSLKVSSLSECESACIHMPYFTCRAFSFRYGPPVIGETDDNCLLTDWLLPDMNLQKHFILDPECELYYRGSYGHGCEIGRYPDYPSLGGSFERPGGGNYHQGGSYLPPEKPIGGYLPPPKHPDSYLPPPKHPDPYLPPPKHPDSYLPPHKPGSAYLPVEKPQGGYFPPPVKPGNAYLPSDKPISGYLPPEKPIGGYLPPKQGGYGPFERPHASYLPPNKDGGYLPPDRPHGSYLPPSKPLGSYIPPEKPLGGYLPPEKPTGIYYPPEKPLGGYLPPEKPTGGYLPPPKHHGGYLPPDKHRGNYYPADRYPAYGPHRVKPDDYVSGGYYPVGKPLDHKYLPPPGTYLPPSHYGVKGIYRPRPTDQLCYIRYSSPARLLPPAIKSSMWVPNEQECKEECTRAREKTRFRCATISYRDGQCELSDIEQRDLRPGFDYLQDKEFWMFTWDFGTAGCYYPPPPGKPPLLNDFHIYGDRGVESTWAHYTVNGQPCRSGTVCTKNAEVGVWTCPVDNGDWDYCCRSGHHCGFSEGYNYPWCYVGSADRDQWRPCSDSYYPYAHSGRKLHWPVAYLHKEGPPNITIEHKPSIVDTFLKNLEKDSVNKMGMKSTIIRSNYSSSTPTMLEEINLEAEPRKESDSTTAATEKDSAMDKLWIWGQSKYNNTTEPHETTTNEIPTDPTSMTNSTITTTSTT